MRCAEHYSNMELLAGIDEGERQNYPPLRDTQEHIGQCPGCRETWAAIQEMEPPLAFSFKQLEIPQNLSLGLKGRLRFSSLSPLQRLVLDTLLEHKGHPSARVLHSQILPHSPRLSRAAVYRAASHLKQCDLIQELDFGEGFKRFDANTSPHVHFFCQGCRMVYDLPRLDSSIQHLTDSLPPEHKILAQQVVLYGLCGKCQ